MSIENQLRKAIQESGLSGNSLAKAAGVSQPVISRFLQGNDIKLSAATRLAAYFGLSLTPDKSAGGKSAKPAAVPAVDWKVAKPKPEGRIKAKISETPPPVGKGKSSRRK